MALDLDFLIKGLIKTTVPKPLSGTLAGHAAGEPFDKHAFQKIKLKYPNNTFRQYEFLNQLYLNNPKSQTTKERFSLIKPRTLQYLLNRGNSTTRDWSEDNLFEEKQNDTADVLVVNEGFFHLIDIKTFNIAKDGQPPNIISALKLAEMCKLMLECKEYNCHDIIYIGLSWSLQDKELVCQDVNIKELFKSDPKQLYINWAAALQIQFHVKNLKQDYTNTKENWCRDYILHFTTQAKKRVKYMKNKWIERYNKCL